MPTASATDRRGNSKGQGRFVRPCLLLGLAIAASSCANAASVRQAARIMAPAASACDPNQLTSYFGLVTGYKRGAKSTWLRIYTDYDTIEAVRVPHAGAKSAQARFLLRGKPFTAKDWRVIERKPGVLHKGTRATAWVCSDGKTAPLIDWNGITE